MKIRFANQLRGIAAIMVVIAHYLIMFPSDNVKNVIGATASNASVPNYLYDIFFPIKHINYGALGVAIFFLISGMVILFSLSKIGSEKFLLQRFFRIFPTYFFVLIVGFISIYLSRIYWNNDAYTAFTLKNYISNTFLVNGFFRHPSVDFVNWTLAIEIKFYIVAALMFTLISKDKYWVIFTLPVLTIFVGLLYKKGILLDHGHYSFFSIFQDLKFIVFLFIGTLFYLHLNKKISTWYLVLGSIFLFTCFIIEFYLEGGSFITRYFGINYLYGLIIFSFCYFFRNKFQENRILDFFADISYPLYLVHSLLGFSLIYMLIDNHIPFIYAAMIALSVSTVIAYITHLLIEIPSNKLGKSISNKLNS